MTQATLSLDHCLRESLAGVDTPVLSAPGKDALSGAAVLSLIGANGTALHAMGLGRGDRVAYALPDSAATAMLSMSLMCVATAAPINPKLPQAEIENALRNLRAKALIVPGHADSQARRAARAIGLPTIDFECADDAAAGQFDLISPSFKRARMPDRARSEEADEAIVVQTSGTTGAAKVVPLTHRNLLSMMLANRERLELTASDRCLGVMPLFHIHGLGALIVSLLSAGSIHILPEFNADSFYFAMRDFAPTWYTAVPTIHQAVLKYADRHAAIVQQVALTRQLRFIRSGSAPMPAGVPERLEQVFNSIYVEASGATECSAYICSNAPGRRKIGSVGTPMTGNEILIVDTDGKPVPTGHEGELIVRGPGVFAGYDNAPELNAQSFFGRYFRTGDLAMIDPEGFVYLTGRLKEQINRAGMKISPREVDAALASHPAVQTAVTFAVPNHETGEEVHAAVVLQPGTAATTIDLQRCCAALLADYKVPVAIHFVEAIPLTSTGKISRVGLAQRLGLMVPAAKSSTAIEPPTSPTQIRIASIFTNMLNRAVDDVDLDFIASGGDSLQAMNLTLELERQFGRSIPLSAISAGASVRKIATIIENDGWKPTPGEPVIFRPPSDVKPTLFCMPGVGGNVSCYAAIACRLPKDQPLVGLPLPGTDGLEAPLSNVGAIASRFVQMIRELQPRGPYLLAGYSFGGRVAFEVARQLITAGQSVGRLLILDTPGPNWPKPYRLHRRVTLHAHRLISNGPIRSVRDMLTRRSHPGGMTPIEMLDRLALREAGIERQRAQLDLIRAAELASRGWKPSSLDVAVTLLRARESVWKDCDTSDPSMGWSAILKSPAEIRMIDGSHGRLFHEPTVVGLSLAISLAIDSTMVQWRRSREKRVGA